MNTAIAKIGTGIYTAPDAAKILRIPYEKSKYWFNYYAKNKLFDSIGYRYYFDIKDTIAIDFLTLIEMYVFYSLKDTIKMKTSDIIKYHKILSKDLRTPYPFANCEIYASKKTLIYESHKIFKIANDINQTFIKDFMIPFYKKITFSEENLAHKFYPLGKEKSVVVNPNNQFGKPVIEGTNIVIETLYDYYLGGDSVDFIAELYGITIENVKDAIIFFQPLAA